LEDFAPESSKTRERLDKSQWASFASQYLDVGNIPIQGKNLEGNIGTLLSKKKGSKLMIPYGFSELPSKLSVQDTSSTFKANISNEGVFVSDIANDLEPFLDSHAIKGITIDVNIKGGAPKLNASRSHFLNDTFFEGLVWVILDPLLAYVEKSLEAIFASFGDNKHDVANRLLSNFHLKPNPQDSQKLVTANAFADDLQDRIFSRIRHLYQKFYSFQSIDTHMQRYLTFKDLYNSKKLVLVDRGVECETVDVGATGRKRGKSGFKVRVVRKVGIDQIVSNSSAIRKGELWLDSTSSGKGDYYNIIKGFDMDLAKRVIELQLKERIGWETVRVLRQFLPKEYEFVKFTRASTKRLIEVLPRTTQGRQELPSRDSSPHRLINVDHPFIKLLTSVCTKLPEEPIGSQLRYFFSLLGDPEELNAVLSIQRIIVGELVKRNIVKDPHEFMLKDEDFPSFDGEIASLTIR
jgi:hypothetical protein